MNCPRCGKSLAQARFEGVLIDQCSGDATGNGGCGGIWLDAGEIQPIQRAASKATQMAQSANQTEQSLGNSPTVSPRIVASTPTEAVLQKHGHAIACPKCKDAMVTYQFAGESGVYVDRCKRCLGIWLDGNEIDLIQKHVSQTALQSNPNASSSGTNPADRRCPRDGTVLSHIEYESEAIEKCGYCHGIWCDDNELGNIVNTIEKKFVAADHPEISAAEGSAKIIPEMDLMADLCCVTCRAPMRRINYAYTSGIIIDRCQGGHGVWLDKDELEKVQIFIERNRAAEHSVRLKYAPILQSVASEASKGFDEKMNRSAKKAPAPIFKVLSSGVDYNDK